MTTKPKRRSLERELASAHREAATWRRRIAARINRAVTREEIAEWLMRKDTEIGLRPCAEFGYWEWRADAPGIMVWAKSKFAAIRKAILAERKRK